MPIFTQSGRLEHVFTDDEGTDVGCAADGDHPSLSERKPFTSLGLWQSVLQRGVPANSEYQRD